MLQTLLVACRQKNVFTDAEFEALKQEIDIADGQANGALSVESVAGFQKMPEQASFFSFLRNLEKSPITSDNPSEFLSKMGDLEQAE
jgi:predicted ATPase